MIRFADDHRRNTGDLRPHLCRHGHRAHPRPAHRPRRPGAGGGRADDRGHWRRPPACGRMGGPVDARPAVRADGAVGPVRHLRLLRLLRRPHHPCPGLAAAAAGHHDRRHGRAVGGADERHRHLRRAAAALPRPDGAAAQPDPLSDRARGGRQYRLGRHGHRQSPEHPDRPGRPARFLALPRRLRAARAGRSRCDPGGRLLAMARAVAACGGRGGRRGRQCARTSPLVAGEGGRRHRGAAVGLRSGRRATWPPSSPPRPSS